MKELPFPRDFIRDEIKGLLQSCMSEVEIWVAQAERRLSQLYPPGSLVEVQLRYGQHNWTPAVVVSSGVNAYGASAYASVTVEIPSRGPRLTNKLRRRTVGLDCIRHIHKETS